MLRTAQNADPDRINVQTDTTALPDGSGLDIELPTWDVYMVADVETWAGFYQQSDLSGMSADYDFHNPNGSTDGAVWDDHL